MKITNPNKRNPSRILLYALLALAVLAAGALPLYQALSQTKVDASAQTSGALGSLPTRLQVNKDGSVKVSFQGKPGALHQIYYTDRLPTATDKPAWTLVADDVAGAAVGWTDWLDPGATTRSRPAGAKQGFYRVIEKVAKTAKIAVLTAETSASTESTSTDSYAALKEMQKRETAEVMILIAGSVDMESALVQKLAETPLTAEYILEVLKMLKPDQDWARKPILEAAVLLRPTQLKPKALARARLLLAGVYSSAELYPEAVQQYLEVTRAQANTTQGWEAWVHAGQIYRLQKDIGEARRCWAEVALKAEAGRWAQEAQWLFALTYHEGREYARALEEFKKLAGAPGADLFRAEAYFWMGEAFRAMQQWDDAYTAYRKVIELNRNLPRSSPYRPQYNRAEKWAREGWTRIAPYLKTETQVTGP